MLHSRFEPSASRNPHETGATVIEHLNLGHSFAEVRIVTECGLRRYSVAKTNPDDVKLDANSCPISATNNHCFSIHVDVRSPAVT
jgi:hypothetical protein